MEEKEINKKPNLLFAVLAAIGLALIGSALYGVLYYLGYIAWIASYLTVVISAWGYKHFNKKMDGKGYVIVAVVSIVGLLVAMFVALGIFVSKELNISIGKAFKTLFELLDTHKDIRSAAVRDGVLTGVFTLFGLLSYFIYEKQAEKALAKKAQEEKNTAPAAVKTEEPKEEKVEAPSKEETKPVENKVVLPVRPAPVETEKKVEEEKAKPAPVKTAQPEKKVVSKPAVTKPVATEAPKKAPAKKTTSTAKPAPKAEPVVEGKVEPKAEPKTTTAAPAKKRTTKKKPQTPSKPLVIKPVVASKPKTTKKN